MVIQTTTFNRFGLKIGANENDNVVQDNEPNRDLYSHFPLPGGEEHFVDEFQTMESDPHERYDMVKEGNNDVMNTQILEQELRKRWRGRQC